jgi:hypothetical protein
MATNFSETWLKTGQKISRAPLFELGCRFTQDLTPALRVENNYCWTLLTARKNFKLSHFNPLKQSKFFLNFLFIFGGKVHFSHKQTYVY